ncbi:P2R3A phosphatase, partial [Upupa epops]|nr:P2R3A phosphatase [Upupa epops]
MAATYRLMVTSVNPYSSVVIDQHFQHTVHYCTGTCQMLKQGVTCTVAHHSVCAELGARDASLDPKTENGLTLSGNEDYQQILPHNPRIRKGSSAQTSSSLKDITGETINLARGKIKEFSFEKVKTPSSHTAYGKGRKVRSDSFRQSFDFDLIYGHLNNDENCPPSDFLQSPSAVDKWQESSDVPELTMSPVVPFSPHSFSEENFITQILEKHKLDGSAGGDIKVCLDILLKCSEDLKKCTNIIKHCIKKKTADSVSGGNSSDPVAYSKMLYMNLMTRFSSYLKKLPFDFKPPGHKEATDLAELVTCLHGLQTPFPPVFGDEQPPRYEDIIQLPSPSAVPGGPPGDKCEVTSTSQSNQTSTVSFTSNSLHSIPQESSVRAVKDACALPQLPATSPSDSVSSTEALYIEEESDGERKKAEQKGGSWEDLERSYELASCSHRTASAKAERAAMRDAELSHPSEKMTPLKPVSDPAARGSQADVSKGEQKCSKIEKEEIDKLLLDLESFSQKMESALREPSLRESEPARLQVSGWQGRQVLPQAPEPKSKPVDSISPLSKIMENSGHKMEEDDKALLVRIMESIENFAQELVEFQKGRGSLSKEKEVMQILQESLTTPSQSLLAEQKSCSASRDSVPASIQQPPEVIKVQSKQEKKPGTPSSAPLSSALSSRTPLPVNKATSSTPLPINIPRFYFPKGFPSIHADREEIIARIEEAFTEFEDEKANICDMGKVATICGYPVYWKVPLFNASGGARTGCVSVHSFVSMWRKILRDCHDDAARFMFLLAKPGCDYLEQEDFVPLLQDVLDTHPGLTFMKDAPEFHPQYITTVIQRIFYTVNRSWSGKITLTELRKSNLLQTLALLEEEEDINQITDYFSYNHFYVIYCKFWELDTDHDLYISQEDLARYSDQALSTRIIERIFSGAVVRGNEVHKEGRMSYSHFVWFLISEEDKSTPTSIEYWFRCMDLDGDGVLSMYELEYFYEEQCERMEALDIEPLSFPDLLCQMLDLVKPEREGRITLRDLKRCRMAPVFYNTFLNLQKYLDNDQRDPSAVQKDLDDDGPEPSDWDRYAAKEYELLVAEESGNDSLQEG